MPDDENPGSDNKNEDRAVPDEDRKDKSRVRFLHAKFRTYEQLNRARELLGLNISQSNKAKTRIRYRSKYGPRKGHLMTFRYNQASGLYQRSEGYGAKKVKDILKDWENIKPTEVNPRRRGNVIWTRAAASLVLDMVDITKVSKKYTNTQIAEQLNRPETEQVYKHPQDRGRVFTAGTCNLFVCFWST